MDTIDIEEAERLDDAAARSGDRPGRRAVLAAILVGARLVLLLLPLILAVDHALPARTGRVVVPDATRYQQLVTHPGRPYRDFPVEYPPLLLGAGHVLHGSTVMGTLVRVGFFSLVLELGVCALLWTGWGGRAAVCYLAFGLPLAFFVYFRLDLLSVFLAVLALWFVERRRDATGGAALALAFFTKFWPAVLLPVLAVRRRWRAVGVAVGSIAAGLATWVAWAGFGGPIQVLTFRGATGWQVESLVGSMSWALLREPTRFESGAIRVGHVSEPAQILLSLAAFGIIALICWRTRGDDESAGGAPALAVTTTLLVAAPILSPQYVAWLLPWAGIAAARRGRAFFVLVLFVAAMTGIMWWLPVGLDGVFEGMLLARNGALVALLITSAVGTPSRRSNLANRAVGAETRQTRGT